MVYLILLIFFVIALFKWPAFRLFVFNPFLDVFYGLKDIYDYFIYRKWDICPSGSMVCYSGLFGRGKTLSAVHTVCRLYCRYNGKKVWNSILDYHKYKTVSSGLCCNFAKSVV